MHNGDPREQRQRVQQQEPTTLAGITGRLNPGPPTPGRSQVRWFDSTVPPDPGLRELVTSVVAATKPESNLASPECPNYLEQLETWFTTVIPDDFDPARDRAAVSEQARLLLSIEGTGTYVRQHGALDSEDLAAVARWGRQRKGMALYARAFQTLAERAGWYRIPVYRALVTPMRAPDGLQCVSWNPDHMATTMARLLYRAEVEPQAIVGISVGTELHPVITPDPALPWVLVRQPE